MITQTRTRYLTALGLLILVGFLVRAVSLDAQSLWRDEVDALRFATAPWADVMGNFTRPGWNGPLYYVLLRGWIALTGTSEYAMRFLSLFFGVLSIPLTYVLGRRLFSSSVGTISAVLVAASPYVVWYSQEVKMYTLVLALALVAVYSLRRAVEGGGWPWWASQIVATSLAFYSHILAALLIPVQLLIYLSWWPEARERWRGGLISLACLTLPYLPLAVWQAPLVLQARETGFHQYELRQMIVILLKGWSRGVVNDGGSWAPALTGILAAGGFLSLGTFWGPLADPEDERTSTASPRNYLALGIWLLVPLLSLWLISRWQPLFTDRYLIWTAPAFYLLVALALNYFASIPDAARWVFLPLLCAVLISNGVSLWKQSSTPMKSDFRAAADYVATYEEVSSTDRTTDPESNLNHSIYLPIAAGNGQSTFDELIIFQIPYGRYTFDYYFPVETYPCAEGLYTNHRTASGTYAMSEAQAAQQMRAITGGHDVIWLIATEVEMWDERYLVQEWLDEHAHRVAEAHFKRVDVYRYELPDA